MIRLYREVVKAVDAAGSEVRVTLAVEGAGTLTRLSNGGNIMCRRCPIEPEWVGRAQDRVLRNGEGNKVWDELYLS